MSKVNREKSSSVSQRNNRGMTVEEDEQQPLSPSSRMMHSPWFNLCVLPVMGFATTIDVVYFKKLLKQTMMQHPRFSSVLVIKDEKRYDYWWKRTIANVDDHVIVPDLDPDMESPDRFVEDYTAKISTNPFDFTKPLWEAHVLNVKTSDANAVVIFRIHHSIGDGVSLISLVIACAKKISDPESLPEFPSKKKVGVALPAKGLAKRVFSFVWMVILMLYYTLLDTIMVTATFMFLEDSKNPFKGPRGIEKSAKRYVHRVASLEDVKLIKNAMNVSINDVLLGVTEAGLSKYLQKQYEIETQNGAKVLKANDIIAKHRIRIAVALNLRASSSIEELAEVILKGKKLDIGKWGNRVGGLTIPLRTFDDPLNYVHYVKTHMDKIKLSLQPHIQYIMAIIVIKLFGVKFAAKMVNRVFSHSSLGFSNVSGPQEEILLFGHPLNYIAPTVSGFPMGVVLHYQSYAKKLIICLAADEKLIPDPQELCRCIQSSLENIKVNVIKRGLVKDFS